MKNNKSAKFTLYWIYDGIGEDWFVIVPCDYNDPATGSYMAEWFYCDYEGLTEVGFVQDTTICYQAMSDDVMSVPLSKIPKNMKIKMKENFKELEGKMQELKELLFDTEMSYIGVFNKKTRMMFKKEFNNNLDQIMNWCWTNLDPDENGYDDPEFDGKYFIKDVEQDDAFSLYKIMIDWQTIRAIIDDGNGYAPVHGQLNLLKNLGFTIIDDGEKTGQRVVVRNGDMYAEGATESQVRESQRIMNIIHGQQPHLN